MKKNFKCIIAIIMVILTMLTSAPLSGFVGIHFQVNATDYKTGDIVQFGSYPQSEVTDSATVTALNNLAPDWSEWISYGYYSGDGDYDSMEPGDWMKYIDVSYNGSKYRGVKFTEYRPRKTFNTFTYTPAKQAYQYANGYIVYNTYWFEFEKLSWRILDPNEGLVLCENIIDAQPYNNTIYIKGLGGVFGYFDDSEYNNYANDYETSSIREWLHNVFFDTAFSDDEKIKIKTTILNNNGYYTTIGTNGYEDFDSTETLDNIFLLSYNDMKNSEYGFNPADEDYETSKRAQGSDYAKSQGLYVSDSYDNSSYWALRTAGKRSNLGCRIRFTGQISGDNNTDNGNNTYDSFIGIRPALKLKQLSELPGLENDSASYADEFTKEHYNFIRNYGVYDDIIKPKNFAYEMTSIKDTTQYDYFKIISLNFDNYYDVVLTDLIMQQTSEETIEDIAIEFVGKEELEIVEKISSYVIELINKIDDAGEFKGKISKNEIQEFFTGELDTEKTAYKILESFFKSDKAKNSLKGFLTGLDKAGKLGDFISLGVDVINDIVHCKNYIVAMNAYIDYDEEFHRVFERIKNKVGGNNRVLSASLQNFISSASSPVGYALEIYSACIETRDKVAFKVFNGIYKKTFLSTLTAYTAGTSLGAVLSAKLAGCTVGGCIAAGITGLTLGVGISQLLTGADAISDHMCIVSAVGELSYYVKQVMLEIGDEFLVDVNRENAELFDNAYRFYINCQLHAYENTCKALEVQKNSVVIKFFTGREKDYLELIEELNDYANILRCLKCHKTDISAKVKYEGEDSYTYSGGEIKPAISIEGLTKGKDYTVKYHNNVDVGTATIEVVGVGLGYKGMTDINYRIVPRDVENIGAEISPTGAVLYWNERSEATGYNIYKLSDILGIPMWIPINLNSLMEKTYDTTETEYVLNSLYSSEKCNYAVKACTIINGEKYSSMNFTPITFAPKLEPPKRIGFDNTTNSITLNWKHVPGIDGYQIFVCTSGTGQFKNVGSVTNSTFTLSNLNFGTTYDFKIKSYVKSNDGIIYSSFSDVFELFTEDLQISKTKLVKVTTFTNRIDLIWSAVSDANIYRVYQKNGSVWKKLGDTTKLTSIIRNLVPGTNYTFAIKAGFKNGDRIEWSDVYATINTATNPSTPTTITATQTTSTITLNWSACKGATGYRVYQYSPSKGKYVQIASLKGKTTYTKSKNLKAGSQYKFKIKPYVKLSDGTVIWGSASSAFTTATKPVPPTKITATTTSSAISLKWTASAGATGYRVYQYSPSKGKYVQIASVKGVTSYKKSKSLKANTTYKFKVKPYVKLADGTVIWGKASGEFAFKTKA